MQSPIYKVAESLRRENDTTDKLIHAIKGYIIDHSSSLPEKQEPKSIIESRFTSAEVAFEKGFVSCGAMTNISTAMLRHLGFKVKLVHGESESSVDHAWINVFDGNLNSWTEYDLQTNDERIRSGHIKKQEIDSWDEIRDQIQKDHESLGERQVKRGIHRDQPFIQYQISPATPEDSAEINKLYRETWISTYPNTEQSVSKEDIEDMMQGSLSAEALEGHKKWIANLPPDLKVSVAKHENKIIGFCYVKKGSGDQPNKLRAIYVDPAYQGQGVGVRLWNEALPFLDPACETEVEVVAYNNSAIKFYKNIGFIDTGVRVLDNQDFKLKSGKILPLAYLKRPATN